MNSRSVLRGDRRQFLGRDKLCQTDMGRRDHVGRNARQLLIVHQQDVLDSDAAFARDFEDADFLPGHCAVNHGSFGSTELI